MFKKLIFTTLLLLIAAFVIAQKPKFYAKTDARKIVKGSYIEVTFHLDSAEGKNFRPPSFTGFDVMSGPSTSSSMQIVNGAVSKNWSVSYGLQPKKIGRFNIGQATVNVNGKTMTSQSISIEVVKGSDKPVDQSKQVYVRAEISDTTCAVGQQIIVDYKLYTQLDVKQAGFSTEPEYDGFYVEQLQAKRGGMTREIINGVEYFVQSLRKVALFPQQTGTYTISAVSINLGIAKAGARQGFFFNNNLIRRNANTRSHNIIVTDPPATALPFSGAVGSYSMQVSSAKRSITTDDAIMVNMKLVGNGDNKTVLAPKWELPDGLEMYDPNIIEDEVFNGTDQIQHRKVFEYLIVAKKPGTYKLKPTFTYFSPDSNDYITVTQQLASIRVAQGSNSNANIVQSTDKQIEGIYETSSFSSPTVSVYNSWWHKLMLGMFFIGALGIYGYGQHLEKSGKRDPELIKKNKAYSEAVKRLEKAQSYKASDKSKEFHEEIVVSLKKYLNDKHNIPALHINKGELISQLEEKSIDTALIGQLETIIDQAEMAIYAPGLTKGMDSIYEDSLKFMAEMEG